MTTVPKKVQPSKYYSVCLCVCVCGGVFQKEILGSSFPRISRGAKRFLQVFSPLTPAQRLGEGGDIRRWNKNTWRNNYEQEIEKYSEPKHRPFYIYDNWKLENSSMKAEF